MLIHPFPGILLARILPRQHLPEYHGAGEDVNLVVVLRVRMPQLWSLPVDGPNKALHHRSRGLFHLRETEVCNFGGDLSSDEDIG